MKNILLLLCTLLSGSLCSFAQTSIDISGTWQFRIDRNNQGIQEQWYKQNLEETILLPGSMPERGKGDEVTAQTDWTGSLYDSSYYYNPYMEKYRKAGNVKLPFFLTPTKHYVGVAWYKKEVTLPKDWKGKRITLFLERPHTETTVWVNNKKVGSRNSLCVAHEYDLTSFLSTGKNQIAIRIDNRLEAINVGKDSHSVSDQTQGNWNGIVGKLELRKTPFIYLKEIQVYPHLADQTATVKIWISSKNASKQKATLQLSAKSFNSDQPHVVPSIKESVSLQDTLTLIEMQLKLGKEMQTWDEFSPALYKLTATLEAEKQTDLQEVTFGMREFAIQGKWFYVNGRKTMLRGTVENCDFPLTGYAPMDRESWERVFRICKQYGLNHMRFHSYCPPEAAFQAADLVGFYLQPEGPSWPNHGISLGRGKPIDTYLMQETVDMTHRYGNYASFCMLACGNEPAGNWVPWVSRFVDEWKARDSRRVYTGASVGNGWKWQPKNQYHVKAGARGLDWNKRQPETLGDYRFQSRIDTVSQPYVSHETGQWCAFPNFEERYKYTGVNRAKNFDIFHDILVENDMEEMGHRFLMASGKLQALCYKHEIERTLRTPDYAGFQLLALNDYSGQGSALVGLLDVFFEEKGYMNAEEFRRFCSPIVPLMRTKRFVYTTADTIQTTIEIANFSPQEMQNQTVYYTWSDEYGKVYHSGNFEGCHLSIGNQNKVGTISYCPKEIEKPMKLNLTVSIQGTEAVNDWSFWVYPTTQSVNQGDVYVTDTLDSKALKRLQQGGKVLILAAGKISYGKEVVQHFSPVFWNTSWFKMRPPHTTGIWVNNYHPLFHEFPTEYHSNLQWWELLNNAQVMQFTRFPKGFQPLVQSIDIWFLSRKIGMLYEANVLNGKLMMTSMDVTSNPEHRIVARQMYKAILDYMNSDQFRPTFDVSPEQIQELFTHVAGETKSFTKDAPDELKNKIN